MSHGANGARVTPRWSAAGQPLMGSPALTAGLLTGMECVCVGPPLFASSPSCGSLLETSPVPPKAQDVPLSRLWPLEVIGPLQLGLAPPVLPATIVFLTFTVPLDVGGLPMLFLIPPPPPGATDPALFSVIVTLVSVMTVVPARL